METLKSILQVLQVDSTFFIYIGLFLALLFFVSRFLVNPAYSQFLYRENSTKGQIVKAEEIQKETQALQKEYEQALLDYNQKFQTALKEKKNKSLQAQQEKIQQAQEKAQKLIITSQQAFQKDFKMAQKELEQKAPQLAQAFISRWTQ